MIDSIANFSDQLNRLDPDDDAFVLHVDDLVEQTSPATLEVAYPAIFRFFEAHPENDCGMSGTLVHMMEDYYPNYVGDLRNRLIECLLVASIHEGGSPLVKEKTQRYLERHT